MNFETLDIKIQLLWLSDTVKDNKDPGEEKDRKEKN